MISVCVCVCVSVHYDCEIRCSFGCVPTGEGHGSALLDTADVAELQWSVCGRERDKLILQVHPLCALMEKVWMCQDVYAYSIFHVHVSAFMHVFSWVCHHSCTSVPRQREREREMNALLLMTIHLWRWEGDDAFSEGDAVYYRWPQLQLSAH